MTDTQDRDDASRWTAGRARRSKTPEARRRPVAASGAGCARGDLGVLPVVVGLIVIWPCLPGLNPVFLSATNLVNLLLECAAGRRDRPGRRVRALVGEIDLSVGSVSGLSSAIVAVLFVNQGWPVPVAIVAAVAQRLR